MFHFYSRRQPGRVSRARILEDYLLYDQFTTDRAAGAVNGTAAEPVGGTRTVTDTNSKVSIVGGKISVSSGGVSNEYVVAYPSISRGLGKVFLFDLNHSTGSYQAGFAITQAVNTGDGSFRFTTISQVRYQGTIINVHDGVLQKYAIVLRASGTFYFGYTSNWILLYALTSGNSATLIPSFINGTTTQVFTADNIRVPKRLFIPVPLQSDGFSAATTDGQGNAENNGPVGNAWTDAIGTWGVSGGARSCSALSGGLGFSYLPCQSSNVIIDAKVTRSAGVAGIVARYASATDYLIAYHDGTNAKLDKVVSGVTTNLVSAAATYSAGAVLRLILDGTNARLFYNNAAVGTVATTPAAGSLNHGLYTTDTGNTFDDLIIWARGNEGQYNGLDSL